jgi:hypothetical protein
MGSIPPAAAFEYPMRELVAVITNSLFVPSDGDLQQVAQAVRSQRMNYAEDTGSANVLSVAFQPAISTYTIGLPIVVKVLNTNTGASTINAGGGRVPIKKPTGAQLSAGDITAGGLAELVYDGAAFQMINFGGAAAGGGTINNFVINIPYTVDTGTPNNVIANFSPAVTSLPAGTILMVKAANTNTGPTTINVNGLGAKNIFALGGSSTNPFLPSDIQTGDILILTYDGTQFWIIPNVALTVNSTFNCANNTDITNIFRALARKRIQPTVTITINLATGIYTPFTTYHIDSSRIVVQGTLLTSVPTAANFARTGSSPAARALDSSNNIAMLRSRYGTEIRFTNAFLSTGGVAVQHTGPGQIEFRNLLITGENTPSGVNLGAAISGPAMTLRGVSIWGAGTSSIFGIQNSYISMYSSFVSSSQNDGISVGTGGSVILQDSGVFGGSTNGVRCGTNGSIYLYANCNSQCNSNIGGYADVGGSLWIGGGSLMSTNGNWDVYGTGNATIVTSATATVGTASPGVGLTANYGAVNLPGG